MEPIFTIPYSEYSVIIELENLINEKKKYSFLIPSKRNQKGYDFVIINNKNGKILRFQVKSVKLEIGEKKQNCFSFENLIYNNKYTKEETDYFVYYGLFEKQDNKEKRSKNQKEKIKWEKFILIFSFEEYKNEVIKRIFQNPIF